MNKISKRFPGVQALDKIQLSIREREIVGIAGENGAGKSTLLKIITGIYHSDEGLMYLRGEPYKPSGYHEAATKGISMVFQEQALVPSLYVYENLFLSHEDRFMGRLRKLDKRKMTKEAKENLEVLNLQHIDPTKLTWRYSFHDRQMIEIAKAFTLSALFKISMPLILLDEPTAGITDAEIDILFKRVREFKDRASFVLISHRLSELMTICDRICVFKDGKNVGEIDPKVNSEQDLHEKMVGRKRDIAYYKENLQKEDYNKEDIVLGVQNLSGDSFSNVSFSLAKQEILGMGGLLGCGKEELGRAIMGIEPYSSGKIVIKGNIMDKASLSKRIKLGAGYIPKERKAEGIIPFLPVSWNITLAIMRDLRRFGLPLLKVQKEKDISEDYVNTLRIATPSLGTLCNSLSGGNQQKVVLAKWLAKKSDILILDNPTRGIDVGAKEEIYALLRGLVNQGLSILVITDDLLELTGLSNRIIIMKDGVIRKERLAPPEDKPTEEELVGYMV